MMLIHRLILWFSLHLLILETNRYVIAETRDNFLQGFYTRSLLKTNHSGSIFEVEETYDNLRGLGKLVLHSPRLGTTVLFSRSDGPLYLDVLYSISGTVKACSASANYQIGGFHLFNEMQEMWPQMKEQRHLIGPASLLYLFRYKLLDYKQEMLKPTLNSTDLHRLILDPRPIEINENVIFKRTAILMNSVPLLKQLAAYLEFEHQEEQYYVDFLEIKQYDVNREESSDIFKMPSILPCTYEAISSLLEDPTFVELNAIASSVELRHNWLDFPRSQPQPHNLVLDSERNLVQFEVKDRWLNVLDLEESLLFHKSSEQSPIVQYKTDVLAIDKRQSEQVRNSECSILATPELANYKWLVTHDSILTRQLSFYLGKYKRNVYLGVESNYRSRGRAHEFELSFNHWQDLPVPVKLLDPPLPEDNSAFPLIGKLWIAATDTCGDLYKESPTCKNPIILGFELHSPDRKLIGSIDFNNFEWHISETQVSSLNLDTCPLKKLKLLLKISSSKSVAAELDKVVLKRMLHYLEGFSVTDLRVVSFRRAQTPYGSNTLAYHIELAESPEVAVEFEKIPNKTSKLELSQIDGLYDVYTSRECLAWASQYGQSRNILYSRTDANCAVYELNSSAILSTTTKSTDSYEIFTRKLQSLPGSGTPIKLFLKEQLKSINKRMKEDNNQNPMQQIRFLDLEVLKEIGVGNEASSGATTLLVAKSKFAQLKSLKSVLSFRDCSFRCQDTQNCTSFSYCIDENLEQSCQLNNESSIVDLKLVTDYSCEIHSKNYLQYFQQPPQPDTDNNNKHQWRLLNDQLFKLNPLECAKVCYSEYSCIRFFHCPNDGCFIWDTANGSTAMLENPTQCDSYTRRSSSFFVASLSKELGPFSWTGNELHKAQVSHHQNVEECAEKCITVSECISFDVCHVGSHTSVAKDGQSNSTKAHLECTLLSGSIYHEPLIMELSTPLSLEGNLTSIDEALEHKKKDSQTFRCRHFERASLVKSSLLNKMETKRQKHGSMYDSVSFYLVNFFIASILGSLAGLTLPNLNGYMK